MNDYLIGIREADRSQQLSWTGLMFNDGSWANQHVSMPRCITLSYYSQPYRIAPGVDRELFFCLAVALGS